MPFTDEHLSQLLDGELSSSDESDLRAALAVDDALAERFAVLAMADARYKNTVSIIDDSPIPESILTLLSEDQAMEKEHRNPIETSLSQRPRSFLQNFGGAMVRAVSPLPINMAVAFTFLFVGVFTVLLWGNSTSTRADETLQAVAYGVLPSENPVVSILNNAPSGSAQQLLLQSDSIVTVTPILSFASTMGDFCREYTLNQSESSHRAVACRQDQGWRVVLSTRANEYQGSEEYQTASSISPSVFEERINSLINGDPLSYQQELLLIEREWDSK